MKENRQNFRIFLFGPPYISLENTHLHISRKKTIALLAYLTVHQRCFTRDRLASLFWPDCDYSHARGNLRKVLQEIHSLCKMPILPAAHEQVGPLDLEQVWVDAHVFQYRSEELRHAEHKFNRGGPELDLERVEELKDHFQATIDLYTDGFLSGFEIKDCDLFDEWQFLYAEYLQQTLSTNLEQLVQLCEYLNDLDTALESARRLIEIDTLNEDGHRTLIRLYLKNGQTQAALRQYRLCEQVLQKELGVEPDQATLDLLPEIRSRKSRPFSPIPSTGPVFLRKETPAQTARAYQEVKLEAVEKIIRDIHTNENSPPLEQTTKRSKELCILGDLTLRSSVYHDGNILRARKYYCRASHINPRCSDAYAGMAFTFFSLGGYGVDARVNERKKIKIERLVERALLNDPTHSRALMVLAGKKMEWDWDLSEAEALFQKALYNNPDHPDTLLWDAELLMVTTRFEEAYPLLQRAHELQPVDIAINYRLAKYYRQIGLFDKSLRLLNIIDELYPEHYLVNSLLIFVLIALGHYKNAARAAEYGTALQENGVTLSDLAIARAFAGEKKTAEQALNKGIHEFEQNGEDAYFLALALHTLNRDSEALDWLDLAYRQHDISLLKMCTEPLWTNLHWNSRFQELAGKVGVPLHPEYIQQMLSKM